MGAQRMSWDTARELLGMSRAEWDQLVEEVHREETSRLYDSYQKRFLEEAKRKKGGTVAMPGNSYVSWGGTALENSTKTVYMLFEPGKRNPTPVLLVQKNPDGTGNFIQVDGNGKFNFILSLPTNRPYQDDASKGYAVPATGVE